MSLIIDCHAHLETNTLNLKQLVQKIGANGIHRAVLIAKITQGPQPQKSSILLDTQRAMMNSDFLRPIAQLTSETFYNPQGELRFFWKPFTKNNVGYKKILSPDNQSVVEAIRQYPDHFWGWIFLNPKTKDPFGELEKWGAVKGMVGIKVHPYWHGYSLADLECVAEQAISRRWPLLVHMGFDSPKHLEWMADRFKKMPIILAHAAMPLFKKVWPLIADRKNLYVDLSSPHLSEKFVHKTIRYLGPDKCLYGSDSPYGFLDRHGDYDYSAVKKWIERAPLSAGNIERILGENFLGLIHV